MKKEEKEIEKLRGEIKELEERVKRAMADYQNLVKRHENNAGEVRKYANEEMVEKLLPVMDNLERVQAYLNDSGLEMVVNQFREVLNSEGVEEIKAEGAEFDPEEMDCVEVVAGEKNKVMNVSVKGYRLNGKVLRAAKVEVGKGK